MQIQKLHLENFRGFAKKTIDLNRFFSLIVGENGQGKTSVLEALAIGCGGIFEHIPYEFAKMPKIEFEQVFKEFRIAGQTLTIEPQYPCLVQCKGVNANSKMDWECEAIANGTKRRGNLDKVSQSIQFSVQKGAEVILPVISHYGTERLWRDIGTNSQETLGPDSRFAGYRDCLNTASSHRRMIDWFKTQELIGLQQKRKIGVLEACRDAIVQCVPDADHAYFDISHNQLILKVNGEAVPVDYLSDGYRNMLALVADIAVKCSTLNPHLERNAPSQTPGIVLIDEIDLHLHPKWQRRVVGDLLRVFPQVQFVATTHSPFVIQSLPSQTGVGLVNLDDPLKREVAGKSVEDIAEEIQGVNVPQRSHSHLELMNQATVYFEMLENDEEVPQEKKMAARAELRKLTRSFSDDPAYQALIKMKELAAEKKSGPSRNGGAAE